jgi:hypothetical protein
MTNPLQIAQAEMNKASANYKTVGNSDRLILRYQFIPTDKPNESWTNILKLVKKDDFIQVWITNGADKYAQYRLDKTQAKQLIEFLQCVVENS